MSYQVWQPKRQRTLVTVIIESVAKKSAEHSQKEETKRKEESVDYKETLEKLNREYHQRLLKERIDPGGHKFMEEHHSKPSLEVHMCSQLKSLQILSY